MMKKNDLILIGAILVICAAFFVILQMTKKEGSKVIITVDGKLYDMLELNGDTEITVTQENGAYNTFRIHNGSVDMTDASCPDKLCVKHNDIHYKNETIVCLPNKVVLEISGGEENEVDIIAN